MISVTSLKKHTGTNIAEWGNKNPNEVATPARFELAVSALARLYLLFLIYHPYMKCFLILLLIVSLACSATESLDNSSLAAPVQSESNEKSSMVKITRVIDGDTMDVRFEDGTTDRVRLLGVDTPETNAPNKPNEYGDITDLKCLTKWGDKSDDYARSVLDGKEVLLVFDEKAGERGYYGRLLAYIEIDDYDFNESLISRGYARIYEEGTSSREERYLSEQNRAISAGKGLWGDCIN